ncbi:hypothetical protein [Emcibacter nanhaiensis]|uniref:Methyl-accepting transducer domain-containing protein n=1 Tax=Emcibacter nanhaiensis TaxID=1505037 RepID=A0A501PJV0_9PROT|nr:hypothetical protein [Emcibacter nanhaiensis]TPD60739.1 hypothetical protein FIV46_08425 [Emcibacter nanhaiensis]
MMPAAIPDTSFQPLSAGVQETCTKIEERLAASRSVIEQDFSDMGARLADSARLLNEISATHANTAATLESEEFKRAISQLRGIRDKILEMIQPVADSHDYLGHLANMAAAISKPISNLCRTVKTIGIVAVNARISAASLNAGKEDFEVFTMGMTKLALSAADAVQALSTSYDEMSSSLAMARTANADLSARQSSSVNQILTRLNSHLEVLEEQNARAATKSVEYAQLLRQITSRIGAAVSALQIGDTTRQRIEHVEQALATLRTHENDSHDGGGQEAIIAVVCSLQVEQLEDAVSEYDGRIADLIATLRALTSDASVLVRESDNSADSLLSSGGTALADLVDDLHRLHALFAEVRDTRAGLADVAEKVMRTFSVMTTHIDAVHKIEEDMRLVSLNTTIQCGRLGTEGRTLSVIAQELHGLTGETVTAASAIMEILADADGMIKETVAEEEGSEGLDLETVETEASSATEVLEAIVSRTHEAVTNVGRQAPHAIGLIEETVNSVILRQELSGNWRWAKGELEALSATNIEWAGTPAALNLLSELRARYTMDSERNVHDRLLGEPSDVASGDPGNATALEIDVEDLLF